MLGGSYLIITPIKFVCRCTVFHFRALLLLSDIVQSCSFHPPAFFFIRHVPFIDFQSSPFAVSWAVLAITLYGCTIGCRSDDQLSSRLPAWYTKYLPIGPTMFISLQKVLLARSALIRGESALLLVFRVFLVRYVLLQLDHVSGTTYLPVCETRKSAAQNSEDNWEHSCFRRTAAHRDFFDYCAL